MSWTSDDSRQLRSTLFDHASRLSKGLDENFTSPNEKDQNLEDANVVDGLFAVARAIEHLAEEHAKERRGT
jgi:hypothetical protein